MIILLIIFLLLSSQSYAESSYIPVDIHTHWANKEIQSMIKDNVVKGYDDGFFMPDKEITIAEFIKMIVLKNRLTLTKNGNEWPDWYINTAIQYKLINKDQFDDYSKVIKRIDCIDILKNYIDLSKVPKSKIKFDDIKSKSKDDI